MVERLLWEQDAVGSNPACPIMANKKNNVLHKRKQRAERRLWYANFMKDKKCELCGLNDPICLEWHHIDPSTKVAKVTRLLESSTIVKVLDEIKKCQCVCANCHRRITHIENSTKPVGYKNVSHKYLPKVILDV